jgi:hypothetical protein
MKNPYCPKELAEIAKAIVKGYREKYDKFLDERRTEWARKVELEYRKNPVDPSINDPEAKERLALLRKIHTENQKYCRRDMEMPDIEFEDQLKRIDYLVEKRRLRKPRPHATIVWQRALLQMGKCNYADAETELLTAIKLNNEELADRPWRIRDIIMLGGDLARCCYMLKRYDEAIKVAERSREMSRPITPEQDREWVEKYADFRDIPYIEIFAYFAQCDARLHHPKWREDESLQRQFTGLWNDSMYRHGVPGVWLIPMKIAVLSDRIWVERVESYVQQLAEQLYIELSGNIADRVVRFVRCKLCGFQMELPRSAAASIALICLFAVSNIEIPYNADLIPQTNIEMIYRDTAVELDRERLLITADDYLKSYDKIPIIDVAIDKIKAEEKPSEAYAYSVGDQNLVGASVDDL